MTRTAKFLAAGPFHGYFSEEAALYRLDPPCIAGGPTKRHGVQSREVSHIIVAALPEDDQGNGPETSAYVCNENAVVDYDFYHRFGAIVDLFGVNDPDAALARLGYSA
jgi:hypothetical protein